MATGTEITVEIAIDQCFNALSFLMTNLQKLDMDSDGMAAEAEDIVSNAKKLLEQVDTFQEEYLSY